MRSPGAPSRARAEPDSGGPDAELSAGLQGDIGKYALALLAGRECEELEEHLLVCSACQERMIETSEYVAVMKAALPAIQIETAYDPNTYFPSTARRRYGS